MAIKKSKREVKPMKGLGVWLDSSPQSDANHQKGRQESNLIHIESIQLPDSQPRRYFDPEKLDLLAQSIEKHGILEPLIVRPIDGEQYELIAGERRYRAAKALKLSKVPVTIKDVDELEATQIALVENLQREDLNPVEETEAILKLLSIVLEQTEQEVCSLFHQAFNAKQRDVELNHNVMIQLETIDQILAQVGRFNAKSFRSNRLPLLKLPEKILDAIRTGSIQYTKAKAIARIKDPETREELLSTAIEENLSLSEIKQVIEEVQSSANQSKSKREVQFSLRCSDVSKKLVRAQVWKNSTKRRKAEALLKELEALIDS